MEEKKKTSKRKIAVIIIVAAAITALIATAALITAHKLNFNAPRPDDPMMVASKSAYVQYEIRNNKLYLSYDITLSNPSDKEMNGFSIKGIFDMDFENGLILDKNAEAMEKLTGSKTFTIAAGETKTYHLIFVASYYRNPHTPSGSLPTIVLTTADGREIKITETK